MTTRLNWRFCVVCAAAFAAVGCSNGAALPAAPSAATGLISGSALGTTGVLASRNDRTTAAVEQTVTLLEKECTQFTGMPGSFCTVLSSNIKGIEAGSIITYRAGIVNGALSSDIVIDPPKLGNNRAFGHCDLNVVAGTGRCTLTGGTGRFKSLTGDATVLFPQGGSIVWSWEGSFNLHSKD